MADDNGGEWVAVAKTADLAPGAMKAIEAKDRNLALYNVGGTFYATENECTHAYAMLTDGTVDGDNLTWTVKLTQPMPIEVDLTATVDGA